MAWQIRFEKRASRDLERLSKQDQLRVKSFLDERILRTDDPRQLGKALSGPLAGVWSYRVGSLRILARIEHGELVVVVIEIDDRSRIYR